LTEQRKQQSLTKYPIPPSRDLADEHARKKRSNTNIQRKIATERAARIFEILSQFQTVQNCFEIYPIAVAPTT
jgi:hypothetical protein